VEGLIKAGCFDSMGVKRSQLMAIYDQAMTSAGNDRKQRATGQLSLFDMAGADEIVEDTSIPLPDIEEYDRNTLLYMEREVMGIYISGHPLSEYNEELKALAPCAELSTADGTGRYKDNQKVRLGGIITSVRTKPVKSGNGLMAYAVIEDLTGSVELAAFPSVFARCASKLMVDNKVTVSGKLNMREDQNNTILVDDIMPLEKAAPQGKLYLRLDMGDTRLFERVKTVLSRFPGNLPVIMVDAVTRKSMQAPRELFINPSDAIMDIMKELLGEENVKLK